MKKSLGVLLAVFVLMFAAACAKSGSDSDGTKEASGSGGSDAVDTSGELTKENFVERLGAAQVEAGSSHMEMTMSLGEVDTTMSGDILLSEDPEDVRSAMKMDMGAMTMDMRMIGTIMYINMGPLSGDKFVKVDLNDPDDPLAGDYGSMTQDMDPAEQLKKFRAGLVTFENQGDGGTIDGVPTTKIHLALDTEKTLGEGAKDLDTELIPETLDYVLYVGDDDLMRKMEIDLAMMPSTITWTKWGEPVDIKAPADDQITDEPLGGLGGLGLGGAAPKA